MSPQHLYIESSGEPISSVWKFFSPLPQSHLPSFCHAWTSLAPPLPQSHLPSFCHAWTSLVPPLPQRLLPSFCHAWTSLPPQACLPHHLLFSFCDSWASLAAELLGSFSHPGAWAPWDRVLHLPWMMLAALAGVGRRCSSFGTLVLRACSSPSCGMSLGPNLLLSPLVMRIERKSSCCAHVLLLLPAALLPNPQ